MHFLLSSKYQSVIPFLSSYHNSSISSHIPLNETCLPSVETLGKKSFLLTIEILFLSNSPVVNSKSRNNLVRLLSRQILIEQNRCATALAGHRAAILFNFNLYLLDTIKKLLYHQSVLAGVSSAPQLL